MGKIIIEYKDLSKFTEKLLIIIVIKKWTTSNK